MVSKAETALAAFCRDGVNSRVGRNLGTYVIGMNLTLMVARGGIEPPTRGFSVRCSTN